MALSPEVQALADLGYAVVPGSLDKQPKVPWKKWQTDPQTPEEQAALGHGSVWGILTGQLYGLVVLDFDGAEGVALATSLKLSPNVITGSGGWHVWIDAKTIGYPVKTCAAVRPGLDVRGEGGLVWTVGRSKKGEYRFQGDHRYHGDKVKQLVDLGLLPERTAPSGDADFGDYEGEGDGRPAALRVLRTRAAEVAAAQPGTRNGTLNKAAFTVAGLVGSGELDYEPAANCLLHAAKQSNTDGLWKVEDMMKVIESSMRSGMLEPWSAEPETDAAGRKWVSVGDRKRTVPATDSAPEWDPPRVPLPLDAWPKAVRDLVTAGAPLTACPPQYIAAAALPALAAAVGGLTSLGLRSTWHIPPSMYVGLVGNASVAKTPALSLALAPVRAAEAAEWVDASDGTPDRRYLVDDVSTEKLGELLKENERGLLMSVDELKGFFGGMGQYKSGDGRDRQFYLSAWSAQPITVDRIKRGSLHVPRPALSIVGGIQPGVFDALTDGEPDGMMERFLLVFGEAVADTWTDEDIPLSVIHAYSDLWHDVRDHGNQDNVVGMTPSAKAAWTRWYDRFHAVPAPERLAGMHGKMRTHVARIALILACCDCTEVQAEHIERAIRIADWFAGETLHVLRVAQSSRPDERRHVKVRERVSIFISDWEAKHGDRPTKSEMLRYGPSGARRARDLDPILEELGVVL